MNGRVIETWQINNRINLYLLEALDPASLGDTLGGKGRTVGEQFAHLHNVRILWLKAGGGSFEGIEKIEKESAADRKKLASALTQSSAAIESLIRTALEAGKMKGFKPHAEAFTGYLISHESHHRGQIMATLKLNNHLPDKKVQYGMWEWGVR